MVCTIFLSLMSLAPRTARGIGRHGDTDLLSRACGRAALVLLAISAATLPAPPPLAAHDLWLAPSSFTPALGEPIGLRLVLGGGEVEETLPRTDDTIVRFVAIGPDGSVDVRGVDGVDPAGFLRLTKPGWYTILYESSPSFTTLAPDLFRAYVVEKGLERPAQTGAVALEKPEISELFRRSLKARIRVEAPGAAVTTEPAEGERPVGLPLELLLERIDSEPGAEGSQEVAAAGRREVVLRLLFDGSPLADALVDVRRLDDRQVGPSARTDALGRLRVSLDAGSWLATTVHLEGSNPATADWESVWASLTFELR